MTHKTSSSVLIDVLFEVLDAFWPRVRLSLAAWMERHMHLPGTSAVAGRYSLSITPYLREPLDALCDPTVQEVAGQKSSQIGWTMGMVMGWIGYTIDHDPKPTIVMFPRDKTARDFNIEKFEPVVIASPSLAEKVEVKTRSRDYRQDHKTLGEDGFIKFVGSNSTAGVKSTAASRLIVEEPDDCNGNLKGQGDSIELLRDRGKTFADTKMLVGGTPTIKGVSSIEAELLKSDQRYWYVACHHCDESAPLRWEQVRYSSDDSVSHPVYGHWLPETARYVCPACGAEWTPEEKTNNALTRGEWRPTAPFRGIRGYYFNELMSPFPQCALPRLVERYLAAVHEANAGNIGPLIAFWNGALGLPWEYKNDVPEEDDLKTRSLPYAEFTVPAGGLVLTVGLDVQPDRLAIVIRAWGRGEESWLVWWGELFGNVLEADVWEEAWQLLFCRTFRHASGAELGISAASFDASDGNTDEAVYKAVRLFNGRLRARRCLAIKGSNNPSADLFSKPRLKPGEVAARSHKATRYGLPLYMVGVSRGKDLILGGEGGGRLKLAGDGPGRIHWFKDVRPDYFEQVLAEIKAPKPGARKGVKAWQKKAGKRNEALDCEVYALHAARSLRIDIFTESKWREIERGLLQRNLFAPPEPEAEEKSEATAGAIADLDSSESLASVDAPSSIERDEDKPTAEAVQPGTPVQTPALLPVQPKPRAPAQRRRSGFSVGRW